MKIIRFVLFSILFISSASFGATSSDFQNAAKLLTAARRGDIQTVQILINAGADVNYVDSTGLSLVCTAVMNNDRRAIQVLQMYGADASNCDRQIKKYKQKAKTAAGGEDYGFFSGLSSSHVLALSALGVAAVVGGLVLLTDVFDSDNKNSSGGGGGSHGGGSGGGGSGSAVGYLPIPYGPAYLTPDGAVDTSFDISENLSDWDTNSSSALHVTDFNFLRKVASNNFIDAGLYTTLENYLLTMRGYYSLASGYMGQNIFRDESTKVPVKAAIENAQGRPVRVALITGNGINPAGSADSADGITYAIGTALDSSTPTVDKYLNNTLNDGNETENTGYDFSGSGSAFNPFANVNDSALGKIVAGWEGKRSANVGDLYGFVPNGQLAIYRTGNGSVWEELSTQTVAGTFNDADGVAGLSYVASSETPDTVTIGGITYTIQSALSLTTVTDPTVTINDVTFDLSSNSNMFVGVCPAELTGCTNIAIYVGTDGAWYVNTTGGNDVDVVYMNVGGTVYTYKQKVSNGIYTNFEAISAAVGKTYSVAGDTSTTPVDLIANVNVIPTSRNTDYLTVKTFTKAANTAGVSDLKTFYSNQIDSYYGSGQGGIANNMFNNYNTTKPMLVMPAGDYLYRDNSTGAVYYDTLDATFENYAPILYGNSLNHDFMTIVGVGHTNGTSAATTISGYGDGTGSSYGKIRLSMWYDGESPTTSNVYASRKCGIAGVGSASAGVDPWCFAAAGPTAEMATASAAGAVASVKSAFSYMPNDQIFTLLALTADGPYLATDTDGTIFNTDTLYEHLRAMYELPYEYDEDSLSVDDYLTAFKDVFGYGLINLERAIKPGYSLYYYDSVSGNIISTSGKKNKFWGNVASNSSRASTVLSMTNRGAITTSFYDVLESVDGDLSLPRVWTQTLTMDDDYRHGLYLGDLLGDFVVDSKAKKVQKVGDLEFGMSLSPRAYNDNFNGLDNLRVAFVSDNFDIVGQYQRYLTDGESRFSGRANGLLALAANAVSSDVVYKVGEFGVGARAFSGAITDESLLENDPVISSQFEPGRLGLANGGAVDLKYNNDKFGFDVSVGVMRETDTVLGMYSDGLLGLRGGNTRYVDAVAEYKPFENVKLSLRGTFADTNAEVTGELISELSNIKSNAFAFGADIGGFGFTVALPLAVVDGQMGYSYAEFLVAENDGAYEVLLNNPHTEYVDLSAQKRELRFSTSYKKALSELTDVGAEFMYRVHPNNTDMFGNESVLMFKLHRRIGF